jgi:hypothetical protein
MYYTINILKKELDELQHSKEKSISLYKKGELIKEKHQFHLKNLNPKIRELKKAIKTLKFRDFIDDVGLVFLIVFHTLTLGWFIKNKDY